MYIKLQGVKKWYPTKTGSFLFETWSNFQKASEPQGSAVYKRSRLWLQFPVEEKLGIELKEETECGSTVEGIIERH